LVASGWGPRARAPSQDSAGRSDANSRST
jgi:hypothetical protein